MEEDQSSNGDEESVDLANDSNAENVDLVDSDLASEDESLDNEELQDYPWRVQESQPVGPMSQLLASMQSQAHARRNQRDLAKF